MVSTFPAKKNAAFKAVFPILDADGDLVTAAATPDSEVSIDGGTFVDCINEATEILTGSGMYYLNLTAAEMNGDVIAIIVKTTTTGAKTTALVFYTAAQTLDETDVVVDLIKTEVDTHPTLAEIEATTILAKEATLTAIKGTGFDTLTDSLVRIHGDHVTFITAAPSIHTPADIWTVTTRALTDKVGFSLSDAGIDSIVDEVMEGTITLRQAIRLMVSMLASKSSGGGTPTLIYRDYGDTKARLTFTADENGNRTVVVRDVT